MVAVRTGRDAPLVLDKKANFAQVIPIDRRADAVLFVGFVQHKLCGAYSIRGP